MLQTLLAELARRNRHNLRTLRRSPAAEISGALGDLGTLLPLMIAMALQGSVDLPATLVWSGLCNVVTGAAFGVPLPVQPMKAIAAAALATPLPLPVVTAAGAWVSLAVLLLSATGALRALTRRVPVPVVKGVQLGAGLRLVGSGAGLILPLPWLPSVSLPGAGSENPLDSRLAALLAFGLLLLTQRAAPPRVFFVPYALLVFLLGLVSASVFYDDSSSAAVASFPSSSTTSTLLPALSIPVSVPDFTAPLALAAALSQLPLTTLNSVLAVSSLATELELEPDFLPPRPGKPAAGVTSLGLSVGAMNLAGCWFGAMPVCHGAGGLAAQHRFGARSGASVVLLGLAKLGLGLLGLGGRGGGGGRGADRDGRRLMRVLQGFPSGLLGVMVIAAGLELGKVGAGLNNVGAPDLWEESVSPSSAAAGGAEPGSGRGRTVRKCREVSVAEQQERWMVMMVTAAGILAFKNDAVGFLAGCCCHGAYRVADLLESRRARAAWRPLSERSPLLR